MVGKSSRSKPVSTSLGCEMTTYSFLDLACVPGFTL
jgi:hypothetical protein